MDEAESREFATRTANECLQKRTASQRVEWALQNLPGEFVLTSSFGAQAAVSLSLITQQYPDIPVVLIDTGYLFPETYQFVDQLAHRLKLNLKVYGPELSPAWQEARYGKRWENGLEGIEAYNNENKVRPLEKALSELKAQTWFAGLRGQQSDTRDSLPVLQHFGEKWKVHPILDWSDKDVYSYLTKHDLPYHPLWEQGYVSIGDVHTTKSLAEVSDIKDTRFFGLKRECGIHDIDFGNIAAA
ncbi:MAG: phosphoadenylyl-sulfate reductase [Pseudomonadota bacterium]